MKIELSDGTNVTLPLDTSAPPKPDAPKRRARVVVATETQVTRTIATKRTYLLADLTRMFKVPVGALFTFEDETGNVVEMRAGSKVHAAWTVTK